MTTGKLYSSRNASCSPGLSGRYAGCVEGCQVQPRETRCLQTNLTKQEGRKGQANWRQESFITGYQHSALSERGESAAVNHH
ncbi:hypothetical protein AMEX_G8190 [Astyanax mexicanus]|uniref:Uncharacterized protein n=1 Tax=Astyanax mexicanus TaxID=7994 RepID=A0A8T2M2P7_ASTMX|nr:hypothetical protein AMEX_G8190 [Astyanax mexicanus]